MFNVIESTPEEAYQIYLQVPEFDDKYPFEKWQRRLNGNNPLCLIARAGNLPVGVKVGYHEADYFYSWIGGVVPAWRRGGIAKMLADEQESLLRQQGIRRIRMKTRNRFKPMLLFALSSGFNIIESIPDPVGGSVADLRIVLEKML